MGVVAILGMWLETFVPTLRSLRRNPSWIGPVISENKTFENVDGRMSEA